ncbi:MAG: bifunctional precorrin-2 dehydrogenase/sirohydrochlorin ferrochelatase [Verrucomicrobia bacterium]|nr:bifunctional precorrin-2 dehydrogenase/sirohydrochlorin ferrochelatase [Verrucomicrobiota bacterium]
MLPYPIFLDVMGHRCVVVGAGAVGQRKAQSLLSAGAKVTVVAPEATARVELLSVEGKLQWLAEPYQPSHLDGARLVFAATDDLELNQRVAADARARGALVNVAEPPEAGDFAVPATVRRGEICIAVSTGGASPSLAKKLREQIEAVVGEEYATLVELLGEMRMTLEQQVKAQNKRQQVYEAILKSDALALLRDGKEDEARQRCAEIVKEFSAKPADETP